MARARVAAVVPWISRPHIGGEERGLVLLGDAKLMAPGDLALAHHHAARELRGIFGGADLRKQCLHLAKAPFVGHAARIARDLIERLGIGGDPSKPMRRVLLALERLAVDLAAGGDLGGDGLTRAIAQRAGGLRRGLQKRDEIGKT